MTIDAVALLQRYHDALNAYDAEVVKAMFAPDAVYVSPGVNGRIEGREAIIAAFSAYFAEHPDQRAIDDRIERLSPSAVRSHWRLAATARSSGQRVARRGRETVEFTADSLIRHVLVEDA